MLPAACRHALPRRYSRLAGVRGARRRRPACTQCLRAHNVSDDEIARLHGPIRLYIGSRKPPEIAVSILAEVTAVKNGVALPHISTIAVAKEKLGPSIACEPA